MSVINKSFTAVGASAQVYVKNGESVYYEYSGTYSAMIKLEVSKDGGQSFKLAASNISSTTGLAVDDASATGTYTVNESDVAGVVVRFKCEEFTSGTAVTKIVSLYKNKILLQAAGLAKVGTTAGFVVAAASNISLVTCPASQTAATLVLPIPYLKQGQIIKGFHLVGQVESAGNIATVDAALRKQTAAAADVSDAAVASITQLSLTADTILGPLNSLLDGLSEVVAEDNNYYILITVTTAAATDVALQGVALILE